MGRGKRRGWGGSTGAEDEDSQAEMVRSDAVNRVGVENTKTAMRWRLGAWLGQGPTLLLDSEGVFEFFHAGSQISCCGWLCFPALQRLLYR